MDAVRLRIIEGGMDCDEESPTRGVISAQKNLEHEQTAMRRHRIGVRKAAAQDFSGEIYLNLGCGPNVRHGWLNVDLFNPDADLSLDLREPWPFADGCAATVYSEHAFEHLEHPAETHHYLEEAHRVLKPGGKLSIGVPDTEWPIRAYAEPSDPYWTTAKTRWHPPRCVTMIDHLNYHFRQDGEHKYAWDFETLRILVELKGFTCVTRRAFDDGIDCIDRALGTIYLDGVKPTAPQSGEAKA